MAHRVNKDDVNKGHLHPGSPSVSRCGFSTRVIRPFAFLFLARRSHFRPLAKSNPMRETRRRRFGCHS